MSKEKKIDYKKIHEISMLSMCVSDFLIWYIRDNDFRTQVNAVVNDDSMKATLMGEEIDVTDMRLTAALHGITEQWINRFYKDVK